MVQTPAARADLVLYSALADLDGVTAHSGHASASGSNIISGTVADDITTAPGTGGDVVDSITFSVVNLNGVSVTFRPIVQIWAADGAGGLPGTLLSTFTMAPVPLPATTGALEVYNPGTPLFTVPTSGTFWAGVTFDNANGTTGATAAELSNAAVLLVSPPTVGSSAVTYFVSSTSGTIPGNNPAGSLFSLQPFNVAFAFSGTAAPVPEPAQLIPSLVCAMAFFGGAVMKKRFRPRSTATSDQ